MKWFDSSKKRLINFALGGAMAAQKEVAFEWLWKDMSAQWQVGLGVAPEALRQTLEHTHSEGVGSCMVFE